MTTFGNWLIGSLVLLVVVWLLVFICINTTGYLFGKYEQVLKLHEKEFFLLISALTVCGYTQHVYDAFGVVILVLVLAILVVVISLASGQLKKHPHEVNRGNKKNDAH